MSTTGTTRNDRALRRREDILDAAIKLFRERGFHGTSLDDIGAAVGITGPAIYRHFDTKEAVLLAALRRGRVALQPRFREAQDLPPWDALVVLLRDYVRVAIEQADIIAIYFQENRYLPDRQRAGVRRDQRHFVEAWAHALSEVRPELNDAEARCAVHAAMNLVNSVAHFTSGLPAERVCRVLENMAMASLLADFSEDLLANFSTDVTGAGPVPGWHEGINDHAGRDDDPTEGRAHGVVRS